MATANQSPLARVREFFSMDLKAMKAEWTQGPLTPAEKKQLTDGVVAFYEQFPEHGDRDAFLNDPKAKAEGVLTY